MSINLSVLDQAVEKSIRPCLIGEERLQKGKSESYHHHRVIPKAHKLLDRESLRSDARGNLEGAITSSVNLLNKFEVTAALNFLKIKSPEEIQKHALDLLYGNGPLPDRLQSFHEWAKVCETDDGKKCGINLTATSYLLAMSDPTQYAFCKPNVYKAAAKALLGAEDEGNSPARLVHATELYKTSLKLFQERYHLPFSDLQHVHIAYYILTSPYEGYPAWDDLEFGGVTPPPLTMLDLNTILYGPPGTGKTYDTIRRAVEICDGTSPPDRSQLVKRFDELRKENRVCFITFHQAYGYEDFIEGLRPVLEDNEPTSNADDAKDIRYECRPGVFKQLCELARIDPAAITGGMSVDWEETTVWKMSLGDTYDPEQATIYDECIKDNVIRLGYGEDLNYDDCDSKADILEKLRTKYPDMPSTDFNVKAVDSLKLGMKEGDLVIISDGNHKFRAIARVTGPYQYLHKDRYRHARSVEWLVTLRESLPREVIYNKNLSQMTIYRLRDDELRREALGQLLSPAPAATRNYVLIIDEINRGNIAKILGELITLLEPDKRLGGENELQVTLPYSGKPFGVPKNVFVIGTMNTADRSIAFLDVALRRRFKFIEMMPEYQLLRRSGSRTQLRSPLTSLKC